MEAAIGPAFSLLAEAQTVGVYVDTFIVKTSGAFKYGVPANLYTVRQSLDGFLFPVPPATHSDPVVANHLAALLNARLGKKKVEIVVFRGRGEKTLKFKVPKSLAEHETKNQ